ncbi:hypothetical protein MPS01_20730 [Marinilactibacillus psychrotolerans]|uniref:Uncharacterized protein n=1 Tax=Marinilactibacillus psychrotolerans TaxID=191770 RepID=A0AAV3WTW8_9LACT|nr:hypothetical protein MPS01_20730 [Marinilactibacillus psychrotolerans]GEQ36138.1 hypothetical protein M132T_16460 [Marinilactibacillus psychrotolerans]
MHHALAHIEFGSYYTQNSKHRNKVKYESNSYAIAIWTIYIEEHEVYSMTKKVSKNSIIFPMKKRIIIIDSIIKH